MALYGSHWGSNLLKGARSAPNALEATIKRPSAVPRRLAKRCCVKARFEIETHVSESEHISKTNVKNCAYRFLPFLHTPLAGRGHLDYTTSAKKTPRSTREYAQQPLTTGWAAEVDPKGAASHSPHHEPRCASPVGHAYLQSRIDALTQLGHVGYDADQSTAVSL